MSDDYVDPAAITEALQEVVKAWGTAQNKWLMQRTADGRLTSGMAERVAIYAAARLYARAFRLDNLVPAEEIVSLEAFLETCAVKTGKLEDLSIPLQQKEAEA